MFPSSTSKKTSSASEIIEEQLPITAENTYEEVSSRTPRPEEHVAMSSHTQNSPNLVDISLNSSYSCHNYASKRSPETPTKSLLRKKVKRLQAQLRHKDKKIKHLEDLVGSMKEQNMVSDTFSDLLLENFSGLPLEIFKHEKANLGQTKNRLTYSEEIRKMAVTLHFYSPRGYKYMRSILTLPHPRTLRNWKSSVDNEPGFFPDVFKVSTQSPIKKKDYFFIHS